MQLATHPGSRRARWTPALLLALGAAAGLVAWQLAPHSIHRTSPDGFPVPPDWTPLTTAQAALHREAAVATCKRQLQEIGQALARYQQERHRLPDQLSDLYPRYLPDRSAFHCPADPTPGAPGLPELHQDPHLPCSYSYEASADRCLGIEVPLGPQIPPPDLPDPEYTGSPDYGTCRNVSEFLRAYFGGWVPMVRCLHHPGSDDEDWVLNLSLDGQIYPSAAIGPSPYETVRLGWRDRPEVIDAAMAQFARDLAAGPAKLQQRWDIEQLSAHVDAWEQDAMGPRLRAIRPRLRAVAGRLLAVAPKLPDVGVPGQPIVQQWQGYGEGQPISRKRLAAEVAAKLYVLAGEYRRAMAALEVARRLPSSNPHVVTDEPGTRLDIARGLGEREKEIALLQRFVIEPPADSASTLPAPTMQSMSMYRSQMDRMAAAEAAAGRPERAARYRLLAEPIRQLLGKPAPEFTLSTATDQPVALRSARRGKRAVLLAFWEARTPGFQGELPYLLELHDRLQGSGFELITILHLVPDGQPHHVPAADALPAPIALQDDAEDVEQACHVQQYPSLVLIDSAGRAVWCAEGFHRPDLAALRQALGRLGLT